MFKTCPKCRGWGYDPDKVLLDCKNCPDCRGTKIVIDDRPIQKRQDAFEMNRLDFSLIQKRRIL